MIIYITAVWLEILLLHIHRVRVALSAGEKSLADLHPAGQEGVDVGRGGDEVAQLAPQVVGQTSWPAGVATLEAVVNREGEAETLVRSEVVRLLPGVMGDVITRYCSM